MRSYLAGASDGFLVVAVAGPLPWFSFGFLLVAVAGTLTLVHYGFRWEALSFGGRGWTVSACFRR